MKEEKRRQEALANSFLMETHCTSHLKFYSIDYATARTRNTGSVPVDFHWVHVVTVQLVVAHERKRKNRAIIEVFGKKNQYGVQTMDSFCHQINHSITQSLDHSNNQSINTELIHLPCQKSAGSQSHWARAHPHPRGAIFRRDRSCNQRRCRCMGFRVR